MWTLYSRELLGLPKKLIEIWQILVLGERLSLGKCQGEGGFFAERGHFVYLLAVRATIQYRSFPQLGFDIQPIGFFNNRN